jgi:hypothetical protein
MKVTVKHINSGLDKGEITHMDNFIRFLQKELPLVEDVTIEFLGQRKGGMSTGSRSNSKLIKVLSSGRMNRDICRTLAHEWVHEFQLSKLKRKHGPDIGGRNENEANSIAGILIKKYEKENPDSEGKMYE